jgi:hypothetical protein
MNIDWQDLNSMAKIIDSEDSESLAKLLIDLLQEEYAARHKKRSNLVSIFSDLIDEEQGGVR